MYFGLADPGLVDGGRAELGRGDTALRFEGPLAGAGDAVSRLSVDDLFMDEYGLC